MQKLIFLIQGMKRMLHWWFEQVWLLLKIRIMPRLWAKSCTTKTVIYHMTYNAVSGSHVHQCITSCSSNLLSWGWWLWKAKMTLFNFDVHHLHWFVLDHNEKYPWSWYKKSVKTNKCRIFLSPKVHFAISLIFMILQLKMA